MHSSKKTLAVSLAAVMLAALFALIGGEALAASGPGEGKDPEALLPGGEAVEGWAPDDALLEYGPEDLWEYINGSAETFLMYDFRKVAVMHYLDGDENEVKVEIYRHGSPLMAFGIYSQYRSPDAEYLQIGNEAFGDEYSIHFWKGDYYVKVDSYSEAPGMDKVMRRFASAVAAAIEDGSSEPAEIGMLPKEGLELKGIVYMTEGVMGSGQLPPAFMAPYQREETEGRVYLFSLGGEEAAAEVFSEYITGLGVSPEKKEASGAVYERAAGEAPYRGRVVALRVSRWMAVVTGFRDAPALADVLAGEIAAGLSGR